MSVEILVFAFGGVLLLIGIVGGGFELKELKFPRVGWGARLMSTASGLAFLGLGMGMVDARRVVADTAPSPAPMPLISTPIPSSPPSEPATPIDFTIRDELGDDQVSEQVTVVIDGRVVGTLTINQHYRNSMVSVTVPRPGQYSYTVEATAVFAGEDGEFQYTGAGQGMIDVTSGRSFRLAGSFSGSTWLISLIADSP